MKPKLKSLFLANLSSISRKELFIFDFLQILQEICLVFGKQIMFFAIKFFHFVINLCH